MDRKEEDYRWEVLRKRMSPLLFQLFNAVFIGESMKRIIIIILTERYSWYTKRDTFIVRYAGLPCSQTRAHGARDERLRIGSCGSCNVDGRVRCGQPTIFVPRVQKKWSVEEE